MKVKKQLAILMILLLVLQPMMLPTKTRAEEKNEIKDMQIEGKHDTDHPAEAAIDGDVDTYWQSPNEQSMEDHSRHLDLDLNGLYQLNELQLQFMNDAFYHYEVYASKDGQTYDKVVAKTDDKVAAGYDTHALDVEARYIRVHVSYHSQSQQVNIADIKVFGDLIDDSSYKIPSIEVDNFEDTAYAAEFHTFKSDESYANEKTIETLNGLVGRVLGETYQDHFIFEIDKTLDNDFFELKNKDNKVFIAGNNGGSLAAGFNHYLKHEAKLYFNPMFESNLDVEGDLPLVEEAVVKETTYDYRYALNFVTFSYTMSFWGWEEYQAFIDWAAMNGYNLVLDILGQEEVLRQTLSDYGYSDDEIKDYITGPAYFGWFYMQNMYSFGGPLPDNWFEERTELARKAHDLMQVYDIKPVMQAFSGQVPLDFADKNPQAKVVDPGTWPGFQRPYLIQTYLTAEDEEAGYTDYFKDVSNTFYDNQKKLFGDYSHYYATDPFHEGGNISGTGMNIEEVYAKVQEAMIDADNDAVWVMQQWQGNITSEKLKTLPNKKQVLALDLQSDLNSEISPMEEHGVPWVWNMLHNFGGRMGLDGELETIATKVTKDKNNTENMVGIGITPEAINNSPIAYDLLADMIWTQDPINYRNWTEEYITYKYGKSSKNLEEAWEILIDTAYSQKDAYYQGASESVINAKPALKINSASTWGHSDIMYDKKAFEEVIPLFISEYETFKDNPAFIYDFVDVTKQLLANAAQDYHKQMANAYDAKNVEEFEAVSDTFLSLIELQDDVLSTSDSFLLGTWIDDSRNMLDTMDDWTKDLFEFNARALITTWGAKKNANGGGLDDYSNRQWSGLTRDYYLPRWEKWVDTHVYALKNDSSPKSFDWFDNGWNWVNKKSDKEIFPTIASDLNLAELAQEAYDEYALSNQEDKNDGNNTSNEINLLSGLEGEVDVETADGYSILALTDENNETGWKALAGTSEASITYTFDDIENMTSGRIMLQQIANEFPMSYTIDIHDGDTWQESVIESDDTLVSRNEFDVNQAAKQVRINFKQMNDNDLEEIKEISLFAKEKNNDNYVNIAKEAAITTSESDPKQGKENLVDGDDESLWVSNNGAKPAFAKLTYDQAAYVNHVTVAFEKNAPDRSFAYQVKATNADGKEVILYERKTEQLDEEQERIKQLNVKQAVRDITVEITDAKVPSTGEDAWPLIAEIEVWQEQEAVDTGIDAVDVSSSFQASSSVEHQDGNPPTNVIDGSFESLWIANNGEIPSDLILTASEAKYIDSMNLHFEKADLPFQIQVIANKDLDNEKVLLDKSDTNEGLDKTYAIDVNENVETVTIDFLGYSSSNATAWPAIAEVELFEKPQNINDKASSVEANVLIDGNKDTALTVEEGEHAFTFTFDKAYDIFATELLTQALANKGITYTLEALVDDEYVEITKQDDADLISDIYSDSFHSILTDELKLVVHTDQAMELQAFNIYSTSKNDALKHDITKVEDYLAALEFGELGGQFAKSALEDIEEQLAAEKAKLKGHVNSSEYEASKERLQEALIEFYKDGFIQINRHNLRAHYTNSLRLLSPLTVAGLENHANDYAAYLEKVADVLYAPHVSQKELDEKLAELHDEYEALLSLLDTKEQIDILLSVISQQLETEVGDKEEMVPQEDWDHLNKIANQAKEDLEDEKDLEAILTTLKEASLQFDEAIIYIDKAALENLYDQLSDVDYDYSGSSYDQLQDALKQSDTILNESVTKADYEDALDMLLKAEVGLEILNRQALQTLVNKAKAVDTDAYEKESLTVFTDSLAKAVELVDTALIEQDDLDKMVTDLTKSMDALQEKPSPEPDDKDDNDEDDGNDNNDNNNEGEDDTDDTGNESNDEKDNGDKTGKENDKNTDNDDNEANEEKEEPTTEADKDKTEDDEDKELPHTASKMYNIILIGFLLLSIGLATFIIRKKARA